MLRIGESSVTGWSNKLAVGYTTVGTFSSPPAGSYDFDPAAGTWYTVRMAYTAASGLVQAKVWPRVDAEPEGWQLEVALAASWRNGAFGFRANRSAEYDNLYINGFKTYYQPVAVG